MSDVEWISFVERLDQCWMQGRLQDLSSFLAQDVVFVSPDGKRRGHGIAQAIESYRQFTSHAHVSRFQTSDYHVTRSGDTAVVEYDWQMTWTAANVEHNETGREILVLTGRDGNWRVAWRTQIPTGAGQS